VLGVGCSVLSQDSCEEMNPREKKEKKPKAHVHKAQTDNADNG